jgi:hypothetical protein
MRWRGRSTVEDCCTLCQAILWCASKTNRQPQVTCLRWTTAAAGVLPCQRRGPPQAVRGQVHGCAGGLACAGEEQHWADRQVGGCAASWRGRGGALHAGACPLLMALPLTRRRCASHVFAYARWPQAGSAGEINVVHCVRCELGTRAAVYAKVRCASARHNSSSQPHRRECIGVPCDSEKAGLWRSRPMLLIMRPALGRAGPHARSQTAVRDMCCLALVSGSTRLPHCSRAVLARSASCNA